MKERLSVSFRLLFHYPAVIRFYIILLIAIFALSGSLYSQDAAKNKAAATPCVKGNCVNGKGEMNFTTGDAYKGTFRKGLTHGQGEMTWKSGDRYKGSWKDGKMDGRGEMKWAMGDRYAGMWKDNQMNGIGEMTWKNGMKYNGQWKNGRQHGNGMLISTDRKVTRGEMGQRHHDRRTAEGRGRAGACRCVRKVRPAQSWRYKIYGKSGYGV